MNTRDHTEIDGSVHAAWRETPGEQAPSSLDDKVLRQAAAAAAGHPRLRPAWARPMAFAATLVICVLVVQNVRTPLTISGDQGPAPPAARDDASGEAVNDGGQADANRRSGRSKAVADPTDRLPDSNTARQRFQESADDAARTLQGVAASAPASLAAGREAVNGSGSITRPSPDDVGPSCTDSVRSSAESWWQCTQDLFEAGHEQAGRLELELLREFYPDYLPGE